MAKFRLIGRLDVKGSDLIKSVHLEGLRVIGPVDKFALKYYLEGADELIFIDCVASLYGRNSLESIIKKVAKNIFIPLTVGGGIRSLDDAKKMFNAGADKVAINTAAVLNPQLIYKIATLYGSQSVVLSIQAKQNDLGSWQVFTENGREPSGKDVINWAKKMVDLGAGEILVTSIDREGTRLGFDVELIKAICSMVSVPVIASGGMGTPEHLLDLYNSTNVSGVAIADILHYNRSNYSEIRSYAKSNGINVRLSNNV
jgi:cyclase